MQLARFLGRVEDLEGNCRICTLPGVDQRRIADEGVPAALDLHQLGQIAHGPAGIALAFVDRGFLLQDRLGFLSQLALQLG
jgi:hypothetical protein